MQQHRWTRRVLVLSEITETDKDKYWMIHLHVESKKYNKLVNIEYINYQKQKQTRRYREQTSGYQQEEGRREGQYMSKAMEGRRLRDTNHHA